MAVHPRILAWRAPWTEVRGGLQSVGLKRVGRDWARARDGTGCRGLFSECGVLSQRFHPPLSLAASGSLVSLHFRPLGWCHLHI